MNNQQSTINNQQSTINNQQSTINNQQSTINNQQSTINNQQSTINNQQSTINNQQSTINNQQSTINNQQSTILWPFEQPSSLISKKTKFSKKISFVLSPLSLICLNLFSANQAYAACPTPTSTSALAQSGGSCTYDGDNFTDKGRSYAVIDIQNGGTATFTAPDVSLHKITYINGGKPEDYSAIYLHESTSQANNAIFNGNVTILKNQSANTRDVAIGGNGNLLVKGDLTISHDGQLGAIFDLGNVWNKTNQKDGSMQIDGKFTGTTERSDFIRVKEGTYTFNGDVELNAAIGGRIFSAGGATVNFNGDTTINNTSVFLDITPNTDPTFNFNKLTITNNSQPANADAIFALRGGTTNFRANTTILAPNTVAIKLGNATLTNDGELSVTSKDGIAIHTIPETSQTSTFINKKNGVLSTTESAIVNDGEGELVINNQGKLSASDSAIFTNTSSGNITATNTGELKGFLDHSNITLNNLDKGLWQVTKDSNIGTLTNTGTIEFPTTNVGTTVLTADTYTGGGKLLVNSRWNEGAADPLNGESQSDLLKINNINGDAVTTVQINAASLGNITQKSQEIFSTNVVEVANDHSGNLFVGKAATDSGVEAQLKRNGNNYRWTLTATTPTDEVLIVSKPIAGYIQMPYINQQMGLSQLGQLHKRVGEQYTGQLGKEKQDTQIWGRVYMDSQDLQGKDRFGSKVQSGFLQFGKDFAFNLTSDNAQSHTGMMVTYGWANSKFYDKYRAENGVVVADKFTGKAHTDMLSIGGYHTYYSPNRFYVDIIGQLSWLQNQYKSEQTVKQHGYGIATSVEIGKSFKLGNSHFAIEPQAQLTYQWLNLQNFNDGIRYVKAKDQHNLTARLGSRLTYSDETLSSAKFNLSANLIQTLVGRSSKIKVGDQNFDERFSNLALELGLGTDIPLTQSLNFYADVRYTRSLSDRNQVFRNSSLGKSSYNTSLGLRYIW